MFQIVIKITIKYDIKQTIHYHKYIIVHLFNLLLMNYV